MAKPRSKPKSGTPKERGAALVQLVIDKIEAEGGVLSGCGIKKHKAKGMAPAALAKLTLPDGKPLPPSLATFLAYDETYLGVLDKSKKLAFRTFNQMMRAEFNAATAKMYEDFARILTGQCLVIPGGSDSRQFMYVGVPDEHGEYPVFVVDTDEVPWVALVYPGFDVCIADGTIMTIRKGTYTDTWGSPRYRSPLAEQARRNFRGLKMLGMFGQDTEHVDGAKAADVVVNELFPMP